ncbi:hypothetical protein [Oceanomicrobium pacificus]|uniref:Uncharacterized protein n=1 Tax=Oceanomicrobium pacificus TaxID=2692916 RepID=A0A6B0TT06_9RHOB|nr:hypothetical protein [Oceanomicrobium pacificus]MXU64935.1 hypothetical protein [Oceanomicrobium pacificus]
MFRISDMMRDPRMHPKSQPDRIDHWVDPVRSSHLRRDSGLDRLDEQVGPPDEKPVPATVPEPVPTRRWWAQIRAGLVRWRSKNKESRHV